MKKNIKIVLSLVLFTIIFYLTSRTQLNGLFINTGHFIEISENVFVSPNTSIIQAKKLQKLINQSYSRNDSVIWIKTKRNKKIIFCADNNTFYDYCPDTTLQAAFLSSPYLSHIVIGPKGFNLDVISHEMCHAELFERLGILAWFKVKFLVPVWFDEGLAMQVNFEERYNIKNLASYIKENQKELISIKSVVSYNDFFKNEDKIWFNYFASKLEVENWLSIVGKEGLIKLIESIDNFNRIEENYSYLKKHSIHKIQ